MAHQTTEPNEGTTIVEGAEGLANASDLTIEQAIALVDAIEFRAANRSDRDQDVIVQLEDWMADFWEDDYDTPVETPWLLVRDVEDYSAKAYKFEGAFHVLEDGLKTETPITASVQQIDHSTVEYEKDAGLTWCAKSGVTNIFAVRL